MAEPEVAAFLAGHPAAHLVTTGPDGLPDATLLPVIVEGNRVIGHLARMNEHWIRIAPGSPALVVASAPTRTSRHPGMPARPSTGAWCRRGTTAPCTSVA